MKASLAGVVAALAVPVMAQDIVPAGETVLPLDEKDERELSSEELLARDEAERQGRILADLRERIAAAESPAVRERLQLRLLKMLKDGEFLDLAVELRDAKETSKSVQAEVCEAICDGMRVGFGIWGTEWYQRYCLNLSGARLARREREYFKSLLILDGLRPEDARCVHRYADSLLYRYTVGGDKADLAKARELFRREIRLRADEAGSADAHGLCGAHWGEFNCLFASGDTNATLTAVREFLARGLREPWQRNRRNYTDLMRAVGQYLGNDPLDLLGLPFHTGAKAFPEPQECTYSEEFAAVPAARIVAKGLARNDPRMRLLEVKYARRGIAIRDDAAFVIRVEVDGNADLFGDLRAYSAAEGYELEVTVSGATVRAKTRQGALWGIVSLIQLTEPVRKAVRVAKIRDWPDVEKRGYLGSWWAPTLEYTLFQKMNTVDHQRHPCFENRFEPLSWHLEREMGRQFHDFGLELFYGMNWISHAPQIPIAFPRTLPYRVEVCKRYAREHIGVYYPLDDIRFPVCDEDLAAFGSAAAIDGRHQSEIYREVTKEFPDWRFVVCAPFYWGPDGRCNMYPEGRDDYLAQWRKDLAPGIEVYWSGPRVKSYSFERRHADWVLESYGRRPYLFQNGMGWHNLLGYTIDAMDWPSTYFKGFLDTVLRGYHLNATTPTDCAKIATLGDALWNLGKYDARRAARRGTAQLMGERMFDILSGGYEDLCYFDKYRYGDAGDNVVEEDLADLERRVANIDRAWAAANAYAKETGTQVYGHYGSGVGYAHKVLEARRHPPDLAAKYAKLLEESAAIARNETHYDANRGDVYLSPVKLRGGRLDPFYKTDPRTKEREKDHPRLTRALCGKTAQPVARTVTGSFPCETFPPEGDSLLCVNALDRAKSKVRIRVNDEVIFEGEREFGLHPQFKLVTFRIPAKVLKRGNSFSIENLGPGVDGWQMTGTELHYGRSLRLAYVVVLATDAIRTELPSEEEGPAISLEE